MNEGSNLSVGDSWISTWIRSEELWLRASRRRSDGRSCFENIGRGGFEGSDKRILIIGEILEILLLGFMNNLIVDKLK